MVSRSLASTLRRSRGSVFEGRRLNHQSSVVDGEAVEVVYLGIVALRVVFLDLSQRRLLVLDLEVDLPDRT